MHTPDERSRDAKDRLWSHIDQAAVHRLHELDLQIESVHKALRQQLDELCAFLANEAEAASERGIGRLLLVLEHSAHLTRQSMTLIGERHQLLRW